MTTELEQSTLTVGQCLKQAREQQQLTAQQVALQLNLKTSLIEELEADRFDPKLSPTFYRGYLRSYARLLKLPEKAVLEQYSKENKGQQQAPSLTRSFSKRTAKEATDSRYIWLTWLVVLSFIVLLVMYFWQNRLDGQPVSAPLPVVETEQTAQQQEEQATTPSWNTSEQPTAETNVSTEPLTQTDNANQPVADTPELGAPVVGHETTPQAAQTVTDPVATNTSVQNQQNPAAPAATVPQMNEEPQAAPTTEPLQSTVSVPAVANTTAANTAAADMPAVVNVPTAEQTAEQPVQTQSDVSAAVGDSRLELNFSADCWVEITDASGKRLAFGARTAGESLSLSGVAPVKVLLGNAAAAQLSFNGQAVDLSGYLKGRVARLTLGQ